MIKNDIPKIMDELKNDSNYIFDLSLTSKDIERHCSNIALSVQRRQVDSDTEEKLNPPLMIVAFHYFLKTKKQLPTQEDFQKFYYDINSDWILEKIHTQNQEAFNSRLARFFASAVRELHFLYLIKETNHFDTVEYSIDLDIRKKVDVLVTKNTTNYGFQVMVGTKRSLEFSNKKENTYRGFEQGNIKLIPAVLDLSNCLNIKTKKDSFKFYKKQFVLDLVEELS